MTGPAGLGVTLVLCSRSKFSKQLWAMTLFPKCSSLELHGLEQGGGLLPLTGGSSFLA
jgi:hypothetical protein